MFFCILCVVWYLALPNAFAQDVSEPIDIDDMLEENPPSVDHGRLVPHLKKIAGLSNYELVIILSGEFPKYAEVIGFRRLPSGPVAQETKSGEGSSQSWSVVYFPLLDETRRRAKKMVCFEGVVPDSIGLGPGTLAWNLILKQVPGAQAGNFNKGNKGLGGFSDCFFFVRDNPWFGGPGNNRALVGGRISRPDTNTLSYKLFDAAVDIRNGLLSCANENYDWLGNLNMEREVYRLPNEELVRCINSAIKTNGPQPTNSKVSPTPEEDPSGKSSSGPHQPPEASAPAPTPPKSR